MSVNWINIGLGSGLLIVNAKPLSEPMMTDGQWDP